MATHEYWQFAFVGETYTDIEVVSNLGSAVPLKVELSNLPVGSAPYEEFPTTLVTQEHIRVLYGLPSNPTGYTLTGDLKILKKLKEFPRDHTDSSAVTVKSETLVLANVNRDEYFFILDELELNDEQPDVWYYTIFYEAVNTTTTDTVWIYSPLNGHDRGFVLTNNTTSTYGDQLFNYFPQGIRLIDSAEGNNTLSRLCQIFGRVFDEIQDRLNQIDKKRFLPMEVDASIIPYIDHLLGWPTNFELSELKRRRETLNALELWKAKGTNDALELALQELTGWDIELTNGYEYVLTTATVDQNLDHTSAPTGWNTATDGDWANQVNAMVSNGTPDLSGSPTFTEGSKDNTFRVMFDSNSWVNTFGVLVTLDQPQGTSALSEDLAYDKISRLLEYLAVHYANFVVQRPT